MEFLEKINTVHVRVLLMILIPLLVFDIAKDLKAEDLPKYAAIVTLLLSPLFKNIAEPKINELKDNIKTKRNKQKNDRKKRDNQI